VTCRTDTAGGWRYRVCPDDPPVAANRLRAIVKWSAVDEITLTGPNVDYTMRTESYGLTPQVGRDGYMGFVGNPARLYPSLATTGIDIAWTLATPGYLLRELSITLAPVAGFPNAFVPADAGTVLLHRDPIVVRGCVVQLVAGQLGPVPLPGVPVSFAGVWWTFPPANVDPSTVMQPPNLVSLEPGLYADRSNGVDTLRRRDLAHVAGQDKTLVLPAVTGNTTVKISDQIGVAPGTVLAFEPTSPDRVEYVAVTSVVGAATPDQPATATLAFRLQLDHEQGTDVYVVTPQAPAASNLFDRDGIRSDQVAFLAGLSGITAGVVEIAGGSAPTEYQTASLYTATTDSNGYYRLPPLSRVASVKLQTPATSLVTSPDYARYENLVDVVTP
jgi:hypothetical protein